MCNLTQGALWIACFYLSVPANILGRQESFLSHATVLENNVSKQHLNLHEGRGCLLLFFDDAREMRLHPRRRSAGMYKKMLTKHNTFLLQRMRLRVSLLFMLLNIWSVKFRFSPLHGEGLFYYIDGRFISYITWQENCSSSFSLIRAHAFWVYYIYK